jgi:hypothetical protein
LGWFWKDAWLLLNFDINERVVVLRISAILFLVWLLIWCWIISDQIFVYFWLLFVIRFFNNAFSLARHIQFSNKFKWRNDFKRLVSSHVVRRSRKRAKFVRVQIAVFDALSYFFNDFAQVNVTVLEGKKAHFLEYFGVSFCVLILLEDALKYLAYWVYSVPITWVFIHELMTFNSYLMNAKWLVIGVNKVCQYFILLKLDVLTKHEIVHCIDK